MIPSARAAYNADFTQEKYQKFLGYIDEAFGHHPPFRIAETPVFLPMDLKHKLFEACELNVDVITRPDFKQLTDRAIRPHYRVPNEDDHTIFLQMDYGIVRDADGSLKPMLIEIQGFPSLYHYQDFIADTYRKFFRIPDHYYHLFNRMEPEAYHALLRDIIVGDENPENVVLLEIEPHSQVTRIDFYAAAKNSVFRSSAFPN